MSNITKSLQKDRGITVLDCTFRDGGYYNKWDFESSLVNVYISAVKESRIKVLELGVRKFPADNFLGAFAYTSDEFIETLNIDKSIMIAVMVNSDEILNSKMPVKDAVNFLFQPRDKSRVELVRIATHSKNIGQCKKISEYLHSMGYKVGLNLMQSDSCTTRELVEISRLVHSWNIVDVLYFADSFGSMEASDVKRVALALMSGWIGDLGFHAHDNRGLALSNTLTALESGVNWVDCTVLGMGRGAGNAKTESLLIELNTKYQTNFNSKALFNLVLENFLPLQKRYGWGSSLLYNLAALNNIHPSYIQEMLVGTRYKNNEILQSIEFMSTVDATKYDKNLLIHAKGNLNNKGSWSAKNWCSGKEVLILGSGYGVQKYKKAIIEYISIYKPIVISINIMIDFPQNLIDIYATANESKMISEGLKYNGLNRPLALSKIFFKKVSKEDLGEILDYGVNIKSKTLEVNNTDCTLPYELSAGYAMCLADIGGADSIGLVGFDGYDSEDSRQSRMNELLALFIKIYPKRFIALTPTTYNIKMGSIYAKKY